MELKKNLDAGKVFKIEVMRKVDKMCLESCEKESKKGTAK